MRKKKLYRRKPELPFSLCLIRGAIGKEFVIKHYSYGAIKTNYPDMTRIIPSPKQVQCRKLFREAHAFAKNIMADPVQKAAWQKKSKRPHRVYNEAVRVYMLKDKLQKVRAAELANQLINKAYAKKDTKTNLQLRRRDGEGLLVAYAGTN